MIGDVLSSLDQLRIFLWLFIGLYYLVSFAFIYAGKRDITWPVLTRGGWFDWATSAFWIIFAILLIWSLITHAATKSLTLSALREFYVYFLFLFAFLYGLIEWHFPRKLDGVVTTEYEAELQYLLISLGAQTTCGYTQARPSHRITESIAAVQTLLGVWFLAEWVSTAVNRAAS